MDPDDYHSEVLSVIDRQRTFYNSGVTKNIKWRLESLKKLRSSLKKYENELLKSLWIDLHKSKFESYETEIGILYSELNLHIKKLKCWSKTQRKCMPLFLFPSKGRIIHDPYGCVLIISPWNYPVQLLLNPLIGAISAGNCAVLKSAPATPNVAKTLENLIRDTFDEEYVAIFSGGRDVNTNLLEQKFDFIFFTGSPELGKVVMTAAAQHLTPMVLELGGKSPCIVDKDANLALAARRIVWGKFLNAGQTCVAPDYLLVHQSVKQKLLLLMIDEIEKQFGKYPIESIDYPRVVSDNAMNRLIDLLDEGELVCGGDYDREQRYIAPTIIDNITPKMKIMQREIFGPLLPVMTFEKLDEVVDYIVTRDKPLALYFFSGSKRSISYILGSTSSGGVCINDVIVHLSTHKMPFGGVGNSGFGEYHGKSSYETFSHSKSVLKCGTWIDLPVKYAPYKEKINLLRKVMK